MNFADMTTFFMTVIAIAVAPGPVVLMLIARSASNDIAGAAGFGLGFSIGGVTIITAVCFGLSAWFTAVPEVFVYSKFVMMAYILWMARSIWKGAFNLDVACVATRRSLWKSVMAGFLTCAISPYMMMLFPLVLPEILDITAIKMPDFAIAAVTTFLALAIGSALIVGFAAQLRRLARSDRSMRIMNRSLATILVTAGGVMAFA